MFYVYQFPRTCFLISIIERVLNIFNIEIFDNQYSQCQKRACTVLQSQPLASGTYITRQAGGSLSLCTSEFLSCLGSAPANTKGTNSTNLLSIFTALEIKSDIRTRENGWYTNTSHACPQAIHIPTSHTYTNLTHPHTQT